MLFSSKKTSKIKQGRKQKRKKERKEKLHQYVCQTVFLNNGKKIYFHSDPSFTPKKNQTDLYIRQRIDICVVVYKAKFHNQSITESEISKETFR